MSNREGALHTKLSVTEEPPLGTLVAVMRAATVDEVPAGD
jgi:hypothetical protein